MTTNSLFESVAPYLENGFILIGFLILLLTGVIQYMVKRVSKNKDHGSNIAPVVEKLSRYIFVICLFLLIHGFYTTYLTSSAACDDSFFVFTEIQDLDNKTRDFKVDDSGDVVKLRFQFNSLDIDFMFPVSKNMPIWQLDNAITAHFDLPAHISVKTKERWPELILTANYQNITGTIGEAGLKDGDILRYRVVYGQIGG